MIGSTAALLISAGIAAAGAAGSAYNRGKARKEEQRNYQNAKDYLNSQYYRDPLSTVGNKAILKEAQRNYQDNLEALENKAVAGGATMENALAARKANNESLDKVYTSLLKGEDARRDRIGQQQLALEGQHSQNVQNGYYQAAQDWQTWGQTASNAALSYGSSQLLGGAVGKAPTFGDVKNNPLTADIIGSVDTSAVGAPKYVEAPGMGGLKGVKRDKNGQITW